MDKLKHQAQGPGGFNWEGEEYGQVMHQEPVRKNEDTYDTNVRECQKRLIHVYIQTKLKESGQMHFLCCVIKEEKCMCIFF